MSHEQIANCAYFVDFCRDCDPLKIITMENEMYFILCTDSRITIADFCIIVLRNGSSVKMLIESTQDYLEYLSEKVLWIISFWIHTQYEGK